MDNWKVNNSPAFSNPENPGFSQNINSNIETHSKKKLFLLIGGIVLFLALVYCFVFFFVLNRKTGLTILVAPEIAEIEIDGKVYKNGDYKIETGRHQAIISAKGFSSSIFEFEAKAGETFKLHDYLKEESGRYTDKDYDILSLIAADDVTIEKVNAYRRKLTLFDHLPLANSENQVYITDQRLSSDCPNSALCVGVTNLGSLTEDETLELIRSLTYDPNDYHILYETNEQKYYKENN